MSSPCEMRDTGNLQVCSLTAFRLSDVCRVVDGITNPSISAFLAAVAVSTVPQRRQRAILLLWRRGVQVIAKRRAAATRRLHDVSLYCLNDCAEIFFRYTTFLHSPNCARCNAMQSWISPVQVQAVLMGGGARTQILVSLYPGQACKETADRTSRVSAGHARLGRVGLAAPTQGDASGGCEATRTVLHNAHCVCVSEKVHARSDNYATCLVRGTTHPLWSFVWLGHFCVKTVSQLLVLSPLLRHR